MTCFFIPNANDREVVIDGEKYHTSIGKVYTCDCKTCKEKRLFTRSEIIHRAYKHFCKDCAMKLSNTIEVVV